ncbi:MAG: hypothetical protein BZ151_08795 [Desulfobacca sp. 4484_104]|nr:MAG: hypothetical protein BZ151_08795 [Desulfobacca sp. 4484_104]
MIFFIILPTRNGGIIDPQKASVPYCLHSHVFWQKAYFFTTERVLLLKWMRIDDLLPWEAIIAETRLLTPKVGFECAKDFKLIEAGPVPLKPTDSRGKKIH